MSTIETDYLVVGAGASGMGFTDELSANSDAEVVLVDRRHRPGGHWNDGYGFLRLHQPSAFYGVNSRPLGNDRIDESGPNAGLYERASGTEVCDYYGRVLDEQMLPSGKVRFFGMSDYVGNANGEHRFISRLTGETTTVRVRRKLVDATYIQTTVGPNHKPSFSVDPDARVVIPRGLVSLADHGSGFTIVGAGKTAMDTCCWLIDQGVAPDRIRWIRPREPWTVERKAVQPLKLMGWFVESFAFQMEAAAQAESVDDFMRRLEDGSVHHRLDPRVEAEIYRGPTLSELERAQLRSIENVVRLGYVLHVGVDEIKLENGSIATDAGQIHVDCSAPGIGTPPLRPIFENGTIRMQRVMNAIDPFSAALIGFVEATRDDEREKNRLCPSVDLSGRAEDFAPGFLASQKARVTWFGDPDVRDWLARTRLTPFHRAAEFLTDPASQTALGRMIANTGPAIENLERLLGRNRG
ncbi:MAG TPA: NAD(P)-binding protein [Actinomycetota bacterium]|nr:NAD(P)-binding protein [Actinomycetota bacterium]